MDHHQEPPPSNPPGRPSPSPQTLHKTLRQDRLRLTRTRQRQLYLQIWTILLLSAGMSLFVNAPTLMFTFSPRHQETGQVVKMKVKTKHGDSQVIVMKLQDRAVRIHSSVNPSTLEVGQRLTVFCTRALLCRTEPFWPKELLYLCGAINLTALVALLLQRRRIRP